MEKVENSSDVAWERFLVNTESIIHATDKAFLIELPEGAEFAGYKFWVSKKLCRYRIAIGCWMLSLRKDFTIKLFDDVLPQREVTEDELRDSLCKFKCVIPKHAIFSETHVPKTLIPEKVEADESLIR